MAGLIARWWEDHPPSAPVEHYRWVIIGLLFDITTNNYMDRNLLGVLRSTIRGDLNFSESDYGDIVFAVSMAQVPGYAGIDTFTDKASMRIGLAIAAMVWCAASAAHDGINLHGTMDVISLGTGV
jgi:MFS transporter, ACS family, hexuronate transporter